MNSKTLLTEYQNLESKITELFDSKVKEVGSILYYDIEDCDNPEATYGDITECPNSYYNDKNGESVEIYITKIDSDGIHIVEYLNNGIRLTINFSKLDGFYAKTDIVQLLENELNKTK